MTEVTLNPSTGAVTPLATPESIKADREAAAKAAIERAPASASAAVKASPESAKTPEPQGSGEAAPVPATPAEDARIAQLVAKERALVQARRAFKEEQAKARAEMQSQMQAMRRQWEEEYTREFRANPIQHMEKTGVSYNDLTQAFLNDGQPTADLQVKALREEMRNFQEQQRAAQARDAARQRQSIIQEQRQAIQEFNEEVADFVKQNAGEYELTNLHNGYNLVSQVIENYFHQTGKVLSPKEAADQVELYLEKAVEQSLATKKWQKRATQPSENQGGQAKAGSAEKRATLTNELTTSTPSMMSSQDTERDRIRRALAALE